MEPQNTVINKVAGSSLITFNLEEYHQPGERIVIDIKDQLYQGLILREKDFREYIKSTDWSAYRNKYVAITCTADAIIPTWAFMLVAIAVTPYAKKVVLGTLQHLEENIFHDTLSQINWELYKNVKIVIKGCSKISVPESAYIEVVNKLLPYAHSIMFGEPCSTVPLYKQPKSPDIK